jgi:predicted nuclease of restriction endonuclease-like (RecB) superfamily
LIDQLSKDLTQEFPQIRGFSRSNLYSIRQWVSFYARKGSIVQSHFGQLTGFGQHSVNKSIEYGDKEILGMLCQIPWGHHLQILSKCRQVDEAIFYVIETGKYNWSCNVLMNQIESRLWQRTGKAITNFEQTLPTAQSDLARELIKDPYSFDFLSLSKEHKERDLESALVDNLVRFLLELGSGFSFVGRQYPLKVGDKEFAIDLLFYHFKLRCFVVVELKAGEFLPEYTGKLNFYLNVVDDLLKQKEDNATIGILICKQRNKIITEYALSGISNPIGISEYQFMARLPENLKDCFPTIERIEEHLSETGEPEKDSQL